MRQDRLMLDALKAIAEALKEPAGGTYWAVRDMLDRMDIYHDDLSGTRVIAALAQAVVERVEGKTK